MKNPISKDGILVTLGSLLLGISCGTFAVWGIGAYFLTSPTQYIHHEKLDDVICRPGSFKQERNENWVTSTFGEYGLETHDAAKLTGSNDKYLIMGDSYIEAHMIPGAERMQNRIGIQGMDFIGIGFSGSGIDDYIVKYRKYSSVIPRAKGCILFIGDITDIFPNNSTSASFAKVSGKFDRISYKWRLYAFRRILKNGMTRLKELDFHGSFFPSPKLSRLPAPEPPIDPRAFWEQRLRELKAAVHSGTLLIVYAPTVPRIVNNAVLLTDEHQDTINAFRETCEKLEIPLLFLQEAFINEYEQSGKFPRGFFNTPIGMGHLNSIGHSLAAKKIANFYGAAE